MEIATPRICNRSESDRYAFPIAAAAAMNRVGQNLKLDILPTSIRSRNFSQDQKSLSMAKAFRLQGIRRRVNSPES